MTRFHTAQEGHVVNILPPVDINGGVVDSDVFSMGKHSHATIIIQQGVIAGASTVKVQACDDFVPSNPEDLPFDLYAEETALGDTLGAKVATAATGKAMTTNNGTFYVIELDAAALPDGKPNVRLEFSDPSAGAIVSAVAILSGSRYAGDQNATAIA